MLRSSRLHDFISEVRVEPWADPIDALVVLSEAPHVAWIRETQPEAPVFVRFGQAD